MKLEYIQSNYPYPITLSYYRTDKISYLGESEVYPDAEYHFIREPLYALFKSAEFDFY